MNVLSRSPNRIQPLTNITWTLSRRSHELHRGNTGLRPETGTEHARLLPHLGSVVPAQSKGVEPDNLWDSCATFTSSVSSSQTPRQYYKLIAEARTNFIPNIGTWASVALNIWKIQIGSGKVEVKEKPNLMIIPQTCILMAVFSQKAKKKQQEGESSVLDILISSTCNYYLLFCLSHSARRKQVN